MELTLTNGKLNINNASFEELVAFTELVKNQNSESAQPEFKNSESTNKDSKPEITEDINTSIDDEVKPSSKLNDKYSDELVTEVLEKMKKGASITFLEKEYNIPYRTLYGWYHKRILKDYNGRGRIKKKETSKKKNSETKKVPYTAKNNKKMATSYTVKQKNYILTDEEQQYKEKILTCLNYLSNVTGKNKNVILNEKYTNLKNVYGIVFEQLTKDIKAERDIDEKICTLDLICLTKETGVQKIFFNSFIDDISNTEGIVSEYSECADVVSELAKLADDKSVHSATTYNKIYTFMNNLFNIDWNYYYKKHKISKNYSRGKIVTLDKRLQEYFMIALNIYSYGQLNK